MQFSTSVTRINFQSPIRFHELRSGQTMAMVAEKYEVDLSKLISDNPGIKDQAGSMVIIDASSSLSKSSV